MNESWRLGVILSLIGSAFVVGQWPLKSVEMRDFRECGQESKKWTMRAFGSRYFDPVALLDRLLDTIMSNLAS